MVLSGSTPIKLQCKFGRYITHSEKNLHCWETKLNAENQTSFFINVGFHKPLDKLIWASLWNSSMVKTTISSNNDFNLNPLPPISKKDKLISVAYDLTKRSLCMVISPRVLDALKQAKVKRINK